MNFLDAGNIAWDWVKRTFGEPIAYNNAERSLRLLEETLGLYQSLDGDEFIAHRLVDEVFSRPRDGFSKELAQVGMIYAALCSQLGYDPEVIVKLEVMRVLNVDPAKPRARMAEKWQKEISHVKRKDMNWDIPNHPHG